MPGATVTSNSGGSFLETIVVRLTTGNPTVDGGHIRVHGGVQSKLSIPRLKASDIIDDYKATPGASDGGTLTFDEAQIITGGYMLYAPYDPEDFAEHWEPFQPAGTAFVFQDAADGVKMAIMEEFLNIHSAHLERLIFQGDTALVSPDLNRFFDGAFKVAANDADVIDVASPIALTSANIEGEMYRAYDLIPDEVLGSANVKWFMSLADFRKWGKSQTDKTYKGKEAWEKIPRQFEEIEIVPSKGVPENKMLICVASAGLDSNLHFALKFRNDKTAIKSGKIAANSEEEFVKMAFKGGVVFSFGEEVVVYNA